MQILVVDEQGEVANRLLALFHNFDRRDPAQEQVSYEVTHVSTKIEAFAAYQVIHPDLIIVAGSEGGDEDKQLCRNIRELEMSRHTGFIFLINPNIPITEELSVACLEEGVDDVLSMSVSDREILARANAVLKLKAMADELRSANHRLQQLSYTDELTGLANMRAFNAHYSRAITECFHGKAGIGVIMIDLDNFKKVNDSSDHLMGSHVISEVGKILRTSGVLTTTDCAARFGGDEYVIFTRDQSMMAVKTKADRLRELIESAVFIKDGRSMRVTASLGVSWTVPGYVGKAEDPIKVADLMLYQSKESGRNCVMNLELRDQSQVYDLIGHLQSTKRARAKPDSEKANDQVRKKRAS